MPLRGKGVPNVIEVDLWAQDRIPVDARMLEELNSKDEMFGLVVVYAAEHDVSGRSANGSHYQAHQGLPAQDPAREWQ